MSSLLLSSVLVRQCKRTGSTATLTSHTIRERSRLQMLESITTSPFEMLQPQLISQSRKKLYLILSNL